MTRGWHSHDLSNPIQNQDAILNAGGAGQSAGRAMARTVPGIAVAGVPKHSSLHVGIHSPRHAGNLPIEPNVVHIDDA